MARKSRDSQASKRTLTYSSDPPPKIHKRIKLTAEEWIATGDTVSVISSNVAAIRYDWRARDLYVQFHKGVRKSTPTYVYEEVGMPTARDMYNVSSMGSFVHQRLKNKYSTRKSSLVILRSGALVQGWSFKDVIPGRRLSEGEIKDPDQRHLPFVTKDLEMLEKKLKERTKYSKHKA